MSTVTLGGDRLGAGNKQKVELHNYSRSTHDLSYIWRSTMSAGTLVPFMTEVALPGDSFDIDLNCNIMTHPTIGPLFGSYKVQLDVFQCPIRLYNAKLHMNMLNIGLDMQSIKFPQMKIYAKGNKNESYEGDNEQINPSSIFSYLNIRGVGYQETYSTSTTYREFNAIPFLSYWDIYKNYYANKVEEIGAVIHNPMDNLTNTITNMVMTTNNVKQIEITSSNNPQEFQIEEITDLVITLSNNNEPDFNEIKLNYTYNGLTKTRSIEQIFSVITWDGVNKKIYAKKAFEEYRYIIIEWNKYEYNFSTKNPTNLKPQVKTFPLDNIDTMRQNILQDVYNTGAFIVNDQNLTPYIWPFNQGDYTRNHLAKNQAKKD